MKKFLIFNLNIRFSLFHPPSGAFLENNKTLYSSGVKDGVKFFYYTMII